MPHLPPKWLPINKVMLGLFNEDDKDDGVPPKGGAPLLAYADFLDEPTTLDEEEEWEEDEEES
jgi:hypothetical protein